MPSSLSLFNIMYHKHLGMAMDVSGYMSMGVGVCMGEQAYACAHKCGHMFPAVNMSL